LLSDLGALTKDLERQKIQFHNLRQSILTAAFADKLVPQDSSDESASVLLDRIRADCTVAGKPPVKRRGRSSRRTATAAAEPELPLA
jgi:type I restriction enzyme S subunit